MMKKVFYVLGGLFVVGVGLLIYKAPDFIVDKDINESRKRNYGIFYRF